MADGCRLPKVIVVLALLFRIICATSRYDDLLDRIRESKSNEPEVRDFLKSVLKHHNDFRWIAHEAFKHDQQQDHVLTLREPSSKSKRSFHSVHYDSDNPESKSMRKYVYRHKPEFDDFDDNDTDDTKDDDEQSFVSNTHKQELQLDSDDIKQAKPKQINSNLDFDGPVNDIYPYQEDHDFGVPQVDRRFVRETQNSFLYDDHHFDEDDLFTALELGEDAENGEEDEAEFASDERHDRSKRAPSTETLLNEKLMLHRVLNNQATSNNQDVYQDNKLSKNGYSYNKQSFASLPLENYLPMEAIEVIPGSQKGVKYAPGTKIEKYGEFAQSEQDRYNQEDLDDIEAREAYRENQKRKYNKRKCSETLMANDFKVPELFGANASKQDIDKPLSEFYYSVPHDVIGLNQDMMNTADVNNVSCHKFRRSADPKLNDRKVIKIKIFDDGNLVKDIEKTKGSNSVLLTIKKDDIDNNARVNDDYMDGNENIAFNDGVPSKQHILFTHGSFRKNVHMPKAIYQPEEDYSPIERQHSHKAPHYKKYHRVNEMDTTIIPYNSQDDNDIPMSVGSTQPSAGAVNEFKNRLEDQTEPTSAAEQKELGKMNSKYNTEAMPLQTTSERILIIPLKKSIDQQFGTIIISKVKNRDDDYFDDEDTNVEKRSESSKCVQPKSVRHVELDTPKAEAFRSRKLFSINESENLNEEVEEINVPSESSQVKNNQLDEERKKKDIRTMLGMRKDEDYAEDIKEYYENISNADKKAKAKSKLEELKRQEQQLQQRILGSIINSQQERKALKARLAKTKSNKSSKTKKETKKIDEYYANSEGVIENSANNEDLSGNNYQHLIVKDQSDEAANSVIERDLSERRKEKSSEKHILQPRYDSDDDSSSSSDAKDRCCENIPNGNGKHSYKVESSYQQVPESLKPFANSGGNELDIIEKTQAILLHITGPPSVEEQFQDHEDMTLETDDTSNNNPQTVKRLNSDKNEDNDKNPQNVVSEIIKLVQNYKNKVNEYNQNHNNQGNKKEENRIKLATSTSNFDIEEDKNELKLKGPESFTNQQNILKNTVIYKPDKEDVSKPVEFESTTFYADASIISSILEDDSSVHSHGTQKPKKLHPLKENKCNMKTSNESDQEFVKPSEAREGYIKPEVVADVDVDSSESDVESAQIADDYYEQRLDSKQIENQPKIIRKRLDEDSILEEAITENENIFKNQDNSDSESKDTLDLEKSDDNDNDAQANKKREGPWYLNSEFYSPQGEYDQETENHQVYKRNLDNEEADSVYTDEELNKLVQMVDDTSADVQNDQALVKRYKRYKNFDPFVYESIPRLRHSGEFSVSSSTVMSVAPVSTTVVQAPLCDEVEYKKTDNNHVEQNQHKKKKKKHGHKHDNDDDKFGNTCKLHAGIPSAKKSKSQISKDNKLREQTRGKINHDKMIEAQKEQEHIKNVLNGHMVLEIMDKFQNKVKENSKLNSRFGQAMGKKCAADEVELIDKFKEEQSKADVRHAQLMLHQVIVLMNKIVSEQVHRRTCLMLSPTLKSYLKRTIDSHKKLAKSCVVAEGYPLPAVKDSKGATKDHALDDIQGDFLFPPSGDDADKPNSDLDAAMQMKKKINMIKSLLTKYNHLSHTCQIKVQPVHDYLVDHMRTLEKMYRNKQWGDVPDSCEVPCVHGTGKAAAPPAPAGEGGTGTTTTGSVTKFARDDLPSTESTGASTNGSVSASGGGEAEKSKAKLREITYSPPCYKRNNEGRLFRTYDDGDSNISRDSNSVKHPSEQYERLVEAADKFRRKRQLEERLARLFGKSRTRKAVLATTHKIDDNAEADLSNVAFEAPTVYSLH